MGDSLQSRTASYGIGVPEPLIIPNAEPTSRHRRGERYIVRANPILGGLHG
jgi:hypothetical protein